MKNIRTHHGKFFISILIVYFGFISYSLAQATNVQADYIPSLSEVNTHEKVTYLEIQSDKAVCKSPDPCQQFGKFAEPVINKSVDNSYTISNLSNIVYLITAIILAITLLVLLFSLVPPVMMFSLRKKQEEFTKLLNEKTQYMEKENERLRQEMRDLNNTVHKYLQDEIDDMEKENERLRQEMRDLKNTVHKDFQREIDDIEKENERLRQEMRNLKETAYKDLQNEFRDELMDFLTQKIDKRVDSYGNLVAKQMFRQSEQHEERLYYVEQVHLELLKQSVPDEVTPDNLSKWIIRQQKDYFALLRLISPDEAETFTALDTFRQRELPDSFLALLRFLDKQDRLPGENKILAMEIAQDKFGKSLDPES